VRILIISAALCAACFGQDRSIILLFSTCDRGRQASAYGDPQYPSPNNIISAPAIDWVARAFVQQWPTRDSA
jgi:hypothetical protein